MKLADGRSDKFRFRAEECHVEVVSATDNQLVTTSCEKSAEQPRAGLQTEGSSVPSIDVARLYVCWRADFKLLCRRLGLRAFARRLADAAQSSRAGYHRRWPL
jgi:hypothetical protein